MDKTHRGTVKTLTEKGFGFISVPDRKKDLFFHLRSLQGVSFDELQVGDELVFNIEQGDKGAFATDIERA